MSFSRVFHADDFTDLGLEPDVMDKVARRADEKINNNSVVMYGNEYENGQYHRFTTVYDPTRLKQTHVTLSMGTQRMAAFSPVSSNIKTDPDVTIKETIERYKEQNDLLREINRQHGDSTGALRAEIKALQDELKILKSFESEEPND